MSSVHVLCPVVKRYAWGSTSAIPELLGLPATGEHQAELWLGGHAGGPSKLADGTPLDAYVAGLEGLDGHYEDQLPFMMKVLAAESPLSIQAHPDRIQAADGFAREDAAGLGVGDPARNYKDRHHKPEILVAVSPFSALCGLRDPRRSAEMLRDLTAGTGDAVGEALIALLEAGDLRGAVGFLLSGEPGVRRFASLLAVSVEGNGGPLGDTVRFTAGHYGDDPGVVVAALMNRVDLEPGQAVFLGAGQLHAYLRGVGVEVMAPSDNVLRGGLTPKYVDVGELQRVVLFEAVEPCILTGESVAVAGGTVRSYRPPVEEFEVHHMALDAGAAVVDRPGPGLVLVTRGTVRFVTGGVATVLRRGECGFVEPGTAMKVEAPEGAAEVYLATLPGASVR